MSDASHFLGIQLLERTRQVPEVLVSGAQVFVNDTAGLVSDDKLVHAVWAGSQRHYGEWIARVNGAGLQAL
ncbi:MAG: hypothetical protein HRU17_20655 [Polyangiaceae bacterium]|nr:hypothetical protein [Polyangiaceae bacterium]